MTNRVLPGYVALMDDIGGVVMTVIVSCHYSEKVVVVLRDKRKLFGFLRTLDQFSTLYSHDSGGGDDAANLVLEDCYERLYCQKSYCTKRLGLIMLRGDNMIMLARIVW